MTTLLISQLATAGVAVGVAVAAPDGQICVALAGPALAAGTPLTFVRPGQPQVVAVSAIMGPAPACAPLQHALIPGPYYLAQHPAAFESAPAPPWVAFVGGLDTRQAVSGAIEVRLNAVHAQAQVRSCTSREGLHLTLWSGAPLTSQRLWHQYYYLGYDVEPSCDERETGDRDSR